VKPAKLDDYRAQIAAIVQHWLHDSASTSDQTARNASPQAWHLNTSRGSR
jgi:hypothetical protein